MIKYVQKINSDNVQQNRVILSSLATIDYKSDDEKIDSVSDEHKVCYIKNKSLMTSILDVSYYNSRLMHTIEKIQTDFNDNKSSLLFSSNAAKCTYKHRIHIAMSDWIKEFYDNNTLPSPSPFQQVYCYDNNGNKFKHSKHDLYDTMTHGHIQYIGTMN